MATTTRATNKRSSVQRFRTFDEARQALYRDGYEKGFDAQSVKRFLAMIHRLRPPIRLKPGLRRFGSFDEARESAMNDLMESLHK